ncbi:flagellar export chaperone FlgN [Bythopirellula polymerisocia]|uniref:flagellar export chaperone FlgN n=1 Tax=Bythopirellula polymerisocia TaxID=2528003 RepID=UPI0018D30231|nr:flagellar export chaperone FlgN [Bythopirellula polymerisocia]
MTNLSTDKLADLVAKRHSCLVQLHKLGVRQSEYIATGEISLLLRLLSVKNQLIVALQSIEQQLAPFHDQNPEMRQWDSAEARENCSRQAAECKKLLDQVMGLECENEKKMTQRRDQIAQQLRTSQASASARRAYHAHHTRPQAKPVPLDGDSVSLGFSAHLDLQTGP